ncbi:isoflavone reductase [Cinnamomum micranthum f. kanehirae]|uniref:Isoflavone reductase n=1 Tax=Cinnamomum micranthum f. kanehirae TaxID=337451 RepID=A0A443NV83_9MAGN|nr:isoflavone reductase [Cinnamomum micranthum f. kanehirae]
MKLFACGSCNLPDAPYSPSKASRFFTGKPPIPSPSRFIFPEDFQISSSSSEIETRFLFLFGMAEGSKILIIGGTGYIGKFIVEASAKSGHPTFALVREGTVSDPAKASLIEGFKNYGVILIHGDLYNHESLVKAIKQVDVVISTVGHGQLADQTKIIAAIKEAGNVKRFFPSEFGNDVDRVHAVEPAKSAFATKAAIRRAVEAEGIPYTFVSSNFFAGYFVPSLGQAGATSPPRDKEEDIGTYTIKAVDDPRTLNKILYLRPPANTLSLNDLVSLWEKKIGKPLEKIYVPEEQLLKNIQESPIPVNVILSIGHSVFVKGDHTNFEIEPSFGVEACQLYPDVKYTTVDEILDQMAGKSKILIIGGTGYIGKIHRRSERQVRPSDLRFGQRRNSFQSRQGEPHRVFQEFRRHSAPRRGDVHDHESLVKAIKQVDVVISTVSLRQVADQTKIIAAIKEAGNIQGEKIKSFGMTVDVDADYS